MIFTTGCVLIVVGWFYMKVLGEPLFMFKGVNIHDKISIPMIIVGGAMVITSGLIKLYGVMP